MQEQLEWLLFGLLLGSNCRARGGLCLSQCYYILLLWPLFYCHIFAGGARDLAVFVTGSVRCWQPCTMKSKWCSWCHPPRPCRLVNYLQVASQRAQQHYAESVFAPPVLPDADDGLVGVALQKVEAVEQAAASFCQPLPYSEPDVSQVLQTLLAAYPKRQQLHVLRNLFTLPAARPCPEPPRPHKELLSPRHGYTMPGTWKRLIELETPLLLPPAELQARVNAATPPV